MSRKAQQAQSSSRFRLLPISKMTRRASGEDDEESMDRSLKEASVDVNGMSYDEKKQFFQVIQDSKKQDEEQKEKQRLQNTFHSASSETSGDTKTVPDEKLNACTPSKSTPESSNQDSMYSSQLSPSNVISEDESSSDSESASKPARIKGCSVDLIRIDEKAPSKPRSLSNASLHTPPITKSMGRGRATPTVHSLSDCTSNSSQRNVELWYQSCRQEATSSVQRDISDDDASDDVTVFTQSSKRQQNTEQNITRGIGITAALKNGIDNGSITLSKVDQKDSIKKTSDENDPFLPTEEELNVSASYDGNTSTTKSSIKTQHGTLITDASPLQDAARHINTEACPHHLRGLEKFKGDKVQWTLEAKKALAAVRVAYWKDVLQRNPKWKDSVSERGSNSQTLFRRAPYSGLFNGSGSCAPKQRASTTNMENSFNTPWQSSYVKSSQMQREEKDSMNQEHRAASSRYGSTSSSDNTAKQGFNEESRSSPLGPWEEENVGFRSLRSEKKIKYFDEDVSTPSSPNANSVNSDIYDFDDKNDAEDWKPANKNRRNTKKGGKLNNDADFEVQGKQSSRGRGAAVKKSRGARVAKGAISRPTEHLHRTNNNDTRKPEEQFEVQAADENQANNDKSAWLSAEAPKSKETSSAGIAPSAFFSGDKKPRNTYRKIESAPARNNRRLAAVNNKLTENIEETSVSPRNVACPICNGQFNESDIEAHASGCQEFQTAVEGDQQQDDSGSGGDNIEVITNTNQPTTGTVSSTLTRDSSPIEQCELCYEHFTSTELSIHIKDCIDKSVTPSAGQKRASTEDEEAPARKTTRRLSLNKK